MLVKPFSGWSKLEKAAAVITTIAGSVTAIAVATKTILETKELAQKQEQKEEQNETTEEKK